MQRALISVLAWPACSMIIAPGAVLAQSSDADGYANGSHMMWWGEGWYAMLPGPLFITLVLALLIIILIQGTALPNRNVDRASMEISRSASPAARSTQRNSRCRVE